MHRFSVRALDGSLGGCAVARGLGVGDCSARWANRNWSPTVGRAGWTLLFPELASTAKAIDDLHAAGKA